jgi:formate dehydrogenase iron-sulfur subunit
LPPYDELKPKVMKYRTSYEKNNWHDGDEEKDLCETAASVIQGKEVDGETIYIKRVCMHCNQPACESVCPVGALVKQDIGAVIYKKDICMGCRYCMLGCPFQVPTYQWFNAVPYVVKCDMCFDRISQGNITTCSEVCPTEATIFGDRDELIKIAHERIEEETSKQLFLYGEKEIGGTGTLLLTELTPEQLEQLTLPNALSKDHLPLEKPLPEYTFEVLSKVPHVVVMGVSGLAGIWWITKRRKEVAEFEKNNSEDKK